MKVLFVITGFGYGDSIRVDCIIKEFLKRKPETKIMVAGYDFSYNFFKDKFPAMKIKSYNFLGSNLKFNLFSFLIMNFYLPLLWFFGIRNYKKEVEKFDPDIIVSDFEPIGVFLAKKLKKKCVIIFAYDPKIFGRMEKNIQLKMQAKYIESLYEMADKVIIPSFKFKGSRGNCVYVNPIVRRIPEGLPNEKVLMRKLKLKKKPILVMLGGSNFGLSLAREILKISRDYKEDFIFFGGTKSISEKHFLFTEKFLEYLKVCKGVITLGGNLTLSECLIFKKPMLIFPIENHVEQLVNAYSLRSIVLVGNSNNIKTSIKEFFIKMKKIEKNIKSLNIERNGAEQVVDILLKI